MELGKRIADRMKRLGLTQVQLAKRTGLTQQAISQYIRGQVKPGYDNLVSLAQGLAVKPGWFFSEDESADESPPLRIETFDSVPNPIDADVVAFPDSGKIARNATFTIGHWFPMQQLPPPSAATLSGVVANFHALIFNKLAHLTPPNRIRGALAVDWKPVENGWVFQLRSGVRFHNGEFLTAEDVAGSYQQYLAENPAERWIEGVEVIDPHFIRIHLKSACRFDELAKPIIRQAGSTQASEQWNAPVRFRWLSLPPVSGGSGETRITFLDARFLRRSISGNTPTRRHLRRRCSKARSISLSGLSTKRTATRFTLSHPRSGIISILC
jgi:transcriptional regulator with XRE-family HTH domain